MLLRICSSESKQEKKRDEGSSVGSGFKLCGSTCKHDSLGLTWPTSEALLPALSLEDDCPNGEGSMLRYFLGDEVDGATGMHRRLLGDAGLMSGSKSMVLFRVAPHAITLTCQKMIKNTKVRK